HQRILPHRYSRLFPHRTVEFLAILRWKKARLLARNSGKCCSRSDRRSLVLASARANRLLVGRKLRDRAPLHVKAAIAGSSTTCELDQWSCLHSTFAYMVWSLELPEIFQTSLLVLRIDYLCRCAGHVPRRLRLVEKPSGIAVRTI